MLGFKCATNSPILKPLSIIHKYNDFPDHILFKSKTHFKIPSRFILFAKNSNNESSSSNGKEQQKGSGSGSVNGDDMEKDRLPMFNLKWGDIFNPEPDNIFAVGLTGLLTWASVQVLWQLLVVSLAILVAALKYSFVAALLLFILITLL